MKSLPIFVVILTCVPVLLTAQFQVRPGGKPRPLGKDTLCFAYDFRRGDTVRYYVQAEDSVIIENGQKFAKVRTEMIRVVCDSITSNGRMFLTYTLTKASELNISGKDTTVRNSHPWVGRSQFLSIDKLGHRSGERADNENLAGASPGGTFQPMLLPIIDTACGPQNKTWLSVDTVILAENAIPSPVLVQQNFWRVLDKLDTLGRRAAQLQYTQTGTGLVSIRSRDLTIETTAIIAGYGRLTFDRSLNLLLHQFATTENKFTMNVPGGITVKGVHMTTENITLAELTSPTKGRRWKAPSRKNR